MAHQKLLIGMAGLLIVAAGGVFVLVNQGNTPADKEVLQEALVAGVSAPGEGEKEEKEEKAAERESPENKVFEVKLQTEQTQEAIPEPEPETLSADGGEPVPPVLAPNATPEPPTPTPHPAPAPKPAGNININTASSAELQQLNGIGPVLASRIIEYRSNTSLFYAIEDIQNVKGIGEVTFRNIQARITVGDVGAPFPEPAPAPPPETSSSSRKININTASYEELQAITGVGEVIAQRIIDYREQNGPFHEIEDIKKVKGIGEKTFEKMKDEITV